MLKYVDQILEERVNFIPVSSPANHVEPHGEQQFKLLLAVRHRKIAEAAYFIAQKRGFAPGLELQDWLAAEREVDDADRPVA